ncbi:MAG: hypothetical protein QXM27_02790 [Candidatus Pacearchaeota archaeon]
MEEKFFLDEKYFDFLLLAENDTSRAYAFKYKNKILYLEDIPDNYPSITIVEIENLKELKETIKTLKKNGWEIIIDHTKEQED